MFVIESIAVWTIDARDDENCNNIKPNVRTNIIEKSIFQGSAITMSNPILSPKNIRQNNI